MQNLYVEGHEIASHTVTHPNGKDFSYNKWSAEVVGKFKYRTSAIIIRGLYIFHPISKDHFFVFKEDFSENSVLM